MFHFSTFVLLFSIFISSLYGHPAAAAAAAAAVSDLVCAIANGPPQLRYPPPSVRVPPNGNYHGMKFNHWKLPQAQDTYGTLFVSHTSRQSYLNLVNMRGEHYPIFPQSDEFPLGSEVSIVSWSKCADATVNCSDAYALVTVFGYFRPIGALGPTDRKPAAAWNYTSTGILAQTTNLYAVLGFGVDAEGYGYMVQFETGYAAPGVDPRNAEPCINIVSRREKGPDVVTYNEIVAGLKEIGTRLEDDQFVETVQQLAPMKSDGRRTYEGPTVCDEACMQNEGLVPQK